MQSHPLNTILLTLNLTFLKPYSLLLFNSKNTLKKVRIYFFLLSLIPAKIINIIPNISIYAHHGILLQNTKV